MRLDAVKKLLAASQRRRTWLSGSIRLRSSFDGHGAAALQYCYWMVA